MKTSLLIMLAFSSVLTGFAVPQTWGNTAAPAAQRHCRSAGVVIETDVQSSHRCRLVVVCDESSVVDRGSLQTVEGEQELSGSFRFWHESTGRVLYVYDDTQSLVCRVTNPSCVTIVDVIQ